MSETKKEQETVLVPIKDVLLQSCKKYDSTYDEPEFNLLRRFFVASLNMRFIIKPENLKQFVDKFTSNVHQILLSKKEIPSRLYDDEKNIVKWLNQNFVLHNNVLFIHGDYTLTYQYEATFFQAATSIIMGVSDESPALSIGLTQIVADRIFSYDQTESMAQLPFKEEYSFGDRTLICRKHYTNNKTIAALVVQLLMYNEISELDAATNLFYSGFDFVLKYIRKNKEPNSELIQSLDEIANQLQIGELFSFQTEEIWELIKKYEFKLNSCFPKNSIDSLPYKAFLAMAPDFELAKELLEKQIIPEE